MDPKHIVKVINNFVRRTRGDRRFPGNQTVTSRKVRAALADKFSETNYTRKNVCGMSLLKDTGEATPEEIEVVDYFFKQKRSRHCNYCTRKYNYSLMTGDNNMGACNRPACVLQSMRDHI